MPILRKRVKRNSKTKQQQQTLITSKNLCPLQKIKLNNKVQIASDKTETIKITFNSPEKIWDYSIIRLGTLGH